MEINEAAGAEIMLPPCSAEYLVRWLFEIGPGGDEAIGWRDFAAWQSITGVELLAWEARAIRRAAQEYLAMLHKASEADCPPPYVAIDDDKQAARAAVEKKIDALFGGARKR